MPSLARPAITGVLAAVAGLAAAELLAALLRPESSPLVTIGGSVIDATPTPLKEFAVQTFGTYDKPLLLGGIVAALLAAAAAIGVITARRRPLGLIAMGLLGMVGVAAALTRPTSQPLDALPAVVATFVATALLATHVKENALRRQLLITAGIVAAAFVTRSWRARPQEKVVLPEPADPAPARVTVPGFYTANKDFYRVDTALVVPRVEVDRWELRIGGMVSRPITLTFADLIKRPLSERDITLNCVSNEVGGPYIGNARWLGVPLAPLLRDVGIKAGADQIVARSTEGMTIGTPIETVLDGRDTLLAMGMNGESLPLEHGFPVRMLTPGLYGYAGACKWVTELELTTFDSFDAYWVKRGWASRAPVKTASRIDRPAAFARLPQGEVIVAGVAWAQRRGISKVEIKVDDGEWASAELMPVPSTDTWVQWRFAWQARSGGHSLRVRATDGRGDAQTEQRATPFPDGATGWHTIAVTVL